MIHEKYIKRNYVMYGFYEDYFYQSFYILIRNIIIS